MKLLGHRGTATERPENSLEAFAWAAECGADWIETDVRATADGATVCLHDATVTLASGRRVPIRTMTAADAAHLGIPTLRAAMATIALPFNVDLKDRRPSVGPLVARLIEEHRWHDRIRVASFSGPVIRSFRRMTGGRVATVAGADETSAAYGASRRGWRLQPAYQALQPPVRLRGRPIVDRRLVEWAHRHGIEIHPWTVDDRAEAIRLAAIGVDGLITNRADLLGGIG